MTLPSISVIVPSLNESSAAIAERLRPWLADGPSEVILVDGGTTRHDLTCTVIHADRPGRAHQMNLGAKAATGDLLLFLHADTRLAPTAMHHARDVLTHNTTYVGGAFRFRLDDASWKARLVECGVSLRQRACKLPYGDQGIFVRKSVFESIGGFPEVPILEDVLLIENLKQCGRLYFSPDVAITSARKWQRHGYWKTTQVNWSTMIRWRRGIPLDQIAQYRALDRQPRVREDPQSTENAGFPHARE